MEESLGLTLTPLDAARARFQHERERHTKKWALGFDALLALHIDGVSQTEIGKQAGVAASSIKNFFYKYLRALPPFSGDTYRHYLETKWAERYAQTFSVSFVLACILPELRRRGFSLAPVYVYEKGGYRKRWRNAVMVDGHSCGAHISTSAFTRKGSSVPYSRFPATRERNGEFQFGIFLLHIKGYEPVWYIIPSEVIQSTKETDLYLPLVFRKPTGRAPALPYGEYRNAWHLLENAEPVAA